MPEVADRLDALERRVKRLEDEAAILRLIASYGPAVDSCDSAALGALWADDGSYDFGGAPLEGREAVAALVDLQTHRGYVAAGSGHVLSLPLISVSGDAATALNYSRVYVRHGEDWRVARMSANRWSLRRDSDGTWRVVSRVNRLLDGTPEGVAILCDG